jgi:hypothetical protein
MSNCCKNDLTHEVKNKTNSNCCTKPQNEIKKTRHHMGLSKRYYTRFEDRMKDALRKKKISCCD